MMKRVSEQEQKERKMVNIRDIAKKAGVSVSTVSRVLNNHPYVSEEKRERVQAVVDALNYEQNINAVHLSKGKTNRIAVALPFINHPYFSVILEGIAKEALGAHCQLILCQTAYDLQKEMDALHMLKTKQVDGVIICSRANDWDVLSEYQSYGPIVVCENGTAKKVSSVYVNHYAAFEKALSYLHENGHQKIGYCVGRMSGTNSEQRANAYGDFMKRMQEPIRKEWIFTDCLYITDGDMIVDRLLAMDDRPTGLLVTNDQLAVGVITRCKKEGLSVPKDIAIIGFDNHPLTAYLDITTIELPLFEMGEYLFKLVLDKSLQYMELPFQLIERQTV